MIDFELYRIFIEVAKEENITRPAVTKQIKNYTPRKYAQSVERIKNITKGKNLKLRNSSYKTILELASSGKALGLITREYVEESEYKRLNLVEVKTTLK